MEAQTKTEKFDNYRSMKADLKKAMNAGFYYQAIFIEYAIAEDRCSSALIHAGIKHRNSRGFELKISEKIRKLRDHPAFNEKYPRTRIPVTLLDDLTDWKRERDGLVHALTNAPYQSEALKELAERGSALVSLLSDRVRSVNRYHDKLNLKTENDSHEEEEPG